MAILLGLSLGWYFAELAFNQVPQWSQSAQAAPGAAQDTSGLELALNEEPAKATPKADAKDAAKTAPHSEPGKKDGKHDHAHDTPESVKNLVPGEGQTPWYGRVVWYAVLLFVLAIALGPVVIALKGPDLPDPADKHDDHAGHDAHTGGGGGHGHGH